MMISPENYVSRLKNAPYTELMRERDELLESVQQYEGKEMIGDRSDEGWLQYPSPEVIYQMKLEYLAALCSMMHERYNREYVWGRRTLKEECPW